MQKPTVFPIDGQHLHGHTSMMDKYGRDLMRRLDRDDALRAAHVAVSGPPDNDECEEVPIHKNPNYKAPEPVACWRDMP